METNHPERELLELFAGHNSDELWWNTGPDGLKFYVLVNDVFDWGTADIEPIDLPADLASLRQAKQDVGDDGWPTLWAARKRGQRPQGAMYKYLPETIWPLLDACGPEREISPTNPHSPPKK